MSFSVCCALLTFLLSTTITHAQIQPLLPPFPSVNTILRGPQTLPPQCAPDYLLFPIYFSNTLDRVYWDIPLATAIPPQTTALEIEIACTNTAFLSGLTVHLQSGKGWYNYSVPSIPSSRQRISMPKGLFQSEASPSAWHKSHTLRLSAWKKSHGSTTLTLFSLKPRIDSVAIIRATNRTAPNETAFAASLADRCAHILTKANIPFAMIDDTLDTLDNFHLLLLPYAPTLPESQLANLKRFVKRDGKLIIFYNSSQTLSELLGVRLGAWQGTLPDQPWSALICTPTTPSNPPIRLPHVTNSIIPPFASTAYHARIIAYWADETGRPTDYPACTLTSRGAWFAHVPPRAYPSTVKFFSTLIRELSPSSVLPFPPAEITVASPFLSTPPTEIRAAWHTAALPQHPLSWKGLMKELSQHSINTLYVHLQRAGTRLPLSTRLSPANTLNAALDAGKACGVAVQAWVTCWTLDGVPAAQITQLTQQDRLMRDATGNILPWLCPSIPENRTLIINGIINLVRAGVKGIHLDYVRYPDQQGCYAPATRKAFEAAYHITIVAWPKDVLPGGLHAMAFQTFRNDTITAFVREAREAVRRISPTLPFSVAVFPTPDAAIQNGQAWPAWLREGLVDAVCPMIYTEDVTAFATALNACIHAVPRPQQQLIPGIGTGADECQLDTATTRLQINHVRSCNLAGFAFFAVDDELMRQILPALFKQ